MDQRLFDESFYRTMHGLDCPDARHHFFEFGDRMGLDPNPYFSTLFYKTKYPDWQGSGARTAIEDFLQRLGRGEVRQPHALIDPDYYATRYPDLSELGAQTVLHFMTLGDREVRSPSTGFDADHYQRCYLALGQPNPFRHYVLTGQKLGYLPAPTPRSIENSAAEMRVASATLTRPLLFCVHDAQLAGVPILVLDLAQAAIARGWQPIFLLHRSGPLTARFRELGPVVILAEGWDLTGLSQGLPAGAPVLINSSAAAFMAPTLAKAGHSCLILLHEMAAYIREHGHVAAIETAQAAGGWIVASAPHTAAALKPELGSIDLIRPGIVLPATPLRAFREKARWRGRHAPVFIAAGHADRRKGFDLFLEAAEEIASRLPGARFVWLGALDAWAQGLADQAIHDGLDLTLPGFVADYLAWYRVSDVYLLTSRQDPGPTTAIHAAAVGTPFVGYAMDIGLVDVAEGIGQFVEPDDINGYCHVAVIAAHTNTPASRRRLRRHIRQITSFADYADSILGACQSAGSAVES